MSNMHKNFLIFVDFICKNLTYQQRTKTKQWVDELYYILSNRPAAKTHYQCNNTQTLIRNNELSSNLLKNLWRGSIEQNEYLKLIIEVLKNLDTIAISWVRVKSREIIDYVKEHREKRPMSSMHSSALNGRKTYGSKTTLKTRKSDSKIGAIDNTITAKRVR
jgi:hypothetical protein